MRERVADVVVIGGGAAGLAAAGALGRGRLAVLLLEARERLGGRVWTVRRKGWPGPVELGAEFVHSGNPAFWRFLKQHRIATRNVPPRHWLFREERLKKVDDIAEEIEAVTGEIDAKRMRGWSFADFLRGKAEAFGGDERNLAKGFVEGFQAAEPERMSAAAIEGETLEDEEQFLVPRGYEQVVDALEKEARKAGVRILPRTVVRRLVWKRGDVRVETTGGNFRARAVVIALPLGVWQAPRGARGAVAFAPELKVKRKIARAMGVGHVIRLQVRFDARRWRALLPEKLRKAARGGFGFVHSRVEGVPVWWALSGASVMTGWAGGPAAKALLGRSKRGVFEKALTSLARMFGVSKGRLRAAVADWETHNWSRDPFSRGAYSFIAAGEDDAAESLREPVQDTLFFAGEATADGAEVGTVHGAFASGLRAAAEVGRSLKRSASD